jgi:hypothetical protein
MNVVPVYKGIMIRRKPEGSKKKDFKKAPR